MITDRDQKVIDFITYNPCYSDTLTELFFPSSRVASRRLALLVDYGYIKRYRATVTDKFFYYVGTRPKQMEHMDLVAKTIIYLEQKGYIIADFQREIVLDKIRPDALIYCQRNNKTYAYFVEVERFNNRLPKKIEYYKQIFSKLKSKTPYVNIKLLYVCSRKVESCIDIENLHPNILKECCK